MADPESQRAGLALPHHKRKKGRLNDKRPKSREETPKEGSDNAEALPHRNNMRPRCTKGKSFRSLSRRKKQKLRRSPKSFVFYNLSN
jgi:hypothetical protein